MAKMSFSSPTTEQQKNYFARSAPLRFWAGFFVIVTPLVWGAVDFYGLSGLILPQNPVLSAFITVLLLVCAHGILVASAMMCGYDLFDNNSVESPLLFILPIWLSAGLLWFSWIGAEQIYLNKYAHKAVIVKTDDLDIRKSSQQQEIRAKFAAQKTEAKEAKALARKAVKASFAKSMAAAEKILVHDAQDRRIRANAINAVNLNITAKIGEIDAAEAADLAAIAQNEATEMKPYSDSHASESKAITASNIAERTKELMDKENASSKSFWFSVGLALLFLFAVAARTRTDCKSGIIPKYDHTDGDKSDRVRETVFVFNAIIGSRFSRFLSGLHENYAVEYETITPKRKQSLIAPPPPSAPPAIQNGGNPTPPPPSGGGNGGNGGGGNPPPQIPSVPPTNGKVLPSVVPQTQTANAANHIIQQVKYQELLPEIQQRVTAESHGNMLLPYSKEIWHDALYDTNIVILFYADGSIAADLTEWEQARQLADVYATPRTAPLRNYLSLIWEEKSQVIDNSSQNGAALEKKEMQKRLKIVNPLITADFKIADCADFERQWQAAFSEAVAKKIEEISEQPIVFTPTPSVVEVKTAAPSDESDDAIHQDVYTTYIRGYVKVEDDSWRNPTQFIGLLRNAINRGYTKKVALRRKQLLEHLDDQNITAEIISFCRKNKDMIGEAVWSKFQQVLGEEVTND